MQKNDEEEPECSPQRQRTSRGVSVHQVDEGIYEEEEDRCLGLEINNSEAARDPSQEEGAVKVKQVYPSPFKSKPQPEQHGQKRSKRKST